MESRFLIILTFIIALSLLIGTAGSIGWVVTGSMYMIGGMSVLLFIYLIFSLLAWYGLSIDPQKVIDEIDLEMDEIEETLQILSNPLKPQPYNLGILGTFVLSFFHFGEPIFSFTIALMIIYVATFMVNKKVMEEIYYLTLDK